MSGRQFVSMYVHKEPEEHKMTPGHGILLGVAAGVQRRYLAYKAT